MNGKDVLVFSYIGYLSQEITPGTDGKPINVVLKVDAIGIEEVVVTGYTSMKRKDLTGSVASISADKIAQIPSYDLTSSLVGVAGIRMMVVPFVFVEHVLRMQATTR